MENFVVSARKYRPQHFEDVVGQQSITRTLENAIKNNHLAQAFLFCGPRGVGKTTCARILAKVINTENESQVEDEDFSFNIFELDAASNNSVDDIRSLTDQVRFPPQKGRYKVYIIDEVHMLSLAAFNAFLKTLEEPPAHAIFILATTEKHKVIPTILSRCQIFDFKRIDVRDIVAYLSKIAQNEGVEIEEDALHVIAQKADGALRDALSVFDQVVSFSGNNITYQDVIDNLNVLDYDYYFKVTEAVQNQDVSSALLLFDEILYKGFDGHNFINGLASHFRDLLVCKDRNTLKLLEVADNVKERYYQQAVEVSNNVLLYGLEICTHCDINYKTSRNQRLLVEHGLMKLCSYKSSLAEKKNQLAEGPESKPPVKEESKPKEPPKPEPGNKPAPPMAKSEPAEEKPKAAPKQPDPQPEPGAKPGPGPGPERAPKEKVREAKQKEQPQPAEKQPPKKGGYTFGKKKSKLGLKNLLEESYPEDKPEEKGGDQDEEPETPSGPTNTFTEEQFKEVWEGYLNKLEQEGSTGYFFNAMKTVEPRLVDEVEVHIQLKNATEEKEWMNKQSDLLKHLRENLQNFSVRLVWEVNEAQSTKKYYTNSDRFKRMAEINPKLLDFKKRLDLELD